jgi:uncharacterized membrane protein
MNLAHLHLLLNHVPTVGTILAVGLLVYALVRKDQALERVTLGLFCVIALVAVLAYLTGNAARVVIAQEPGLSEELITAHQDAAMRGLVFMMITGALSWLGLWQFRYQSKLMRLNTLAVLIVSVVTIALMAQAATLGGEIRHPEIRISDAVPGEPSWFSATTVATLVNEYPLVWSISETLHFIGLSLLFGVASVVSLRMLGLMKNVPFDPMRLLPLGLLGFGLNLITGMVFFIATPGQYTENIAFYWKMALMLVAIGNILCLMVFDEAWKVAPGDDAPRSAKLLAASTMVLWIGVIYFGRMLPFMGNSF